MEQPWLRPLPIVADCNYAQQGCYPRLLVLPLSLSLSLPCSAPASSVAVSAGNRNMIPDASSHSYVFMTVEYVHMLTCMQQQEYVIHTRTYMQLQDWSVCIYMYPFTYTTIYIYLCIQTYVYTYTYIYIYIHIYIYVCIYMYIHANQSLSVCIYTYKEVYIQVFMYMNAVLQVSGEGPCLRKSSKSRCILKKEATKYIETEPCLSCLRITVPQQKPGHIQNGATLELEPLGREACATHHHGK